jgi:tRNA pseudouridine38-40 synthase
MLRTLKIVLAYDGTRLVGWQRQADGPSVQGLLEGALAEVEGRAVAVVGAGRTDAGVHALGQVASCRLDHPLPVDPLRRALNAKLPADVRVLDIEEVDPGFHARYSARSKTYRYMMQRAEIANPFGRGFVWSVPHPLDVDQMASAALALEGRHDFAAFQGAGSSPRTTVRTVLRSRVREATVDEVLGVALRPARDAGAKLVVYEIEGDGFLRHMVRNIVGSLVEIGARRRPTPWFASVLASGDRARAGATAPAAGLFLVRVDY